MLCIIRSVHTGQQEHELFIAYAPGTAQTINFWYFPPGHNHFHPTYVLGQGLEGTSLNISGSLFLCSSYPRTLFYEF